MININYNTIKLTDIDLIIFDKDGTLFELYPYWSVVAKNRAENICNIMNINDKLLVNKIAYIMGVDNIKKIMRPDSLIGIRNRQYIQNFLYKELISKDYPIKKQMIIDAFKETDIYISQDKVLKQSLVPVKGIVEFLSSINNKCKCAIFSYDQTYNLKHIVNLMGIDNYFSILLGGDDIKFPKPDPWGVLRIMRDLNISPNHTLLIGDSIHDINSGRSAGCKYIITRQSEISDLKSISLISNFVIKDYTEIYL